MKKKTYPPGISHDESVIRHMRDDPEFAAEMLRVALDESDDEDGEWLLQKTLGWLAAARGPAKVAKAAGIPRESLYRALSRKGNPRLSTLIPIVRAMGLRLTVEPLR
jgi:probable addiction module antidote protein